LKLNKDINTNILSDPAAEKYVLSGIYNLGTNCYYDICDIISPTVFTIDNNQILYDCLDYAINSMDANICDIGVLQSAANSLNISNIINRRDVAQHIKSIIDFPIELSKVRKFAIKIKNLEIARNLNKELNFAQEEILDLTGDEKTSEIIGLAENRILDFSINTVLDNSGPKKTSDDIVDFIKELRENKVDQVGISTGFPKYDKYIGAGLRPGVTIIGARAKMGKSTLGLNMGSHISSLGIPVLNLDTEMSYTDHLTKLIACKTEVPIYKIETGQFADKNHTNNAVEHFGINSPDNYYHISIAGTPFDEQIAIMRRWILKHVGLNKKGQANQCLIVYDYLKLMQTKDLNNMQEYQALGFMLTRLQDFAMKYAVPILGFCQMNRDGIGGTEDESVIAQSDRIAWFCTSFTIFKRKTNEELAEDGLENGSHKLIPIITRYGPTFDYGNYINCHFNGAIAKVTEGLTRFEIKELGE